MKLHKEPFTESNWRLIKDQNVQLPPRVPFNNICVIVEKSFPWLIFFSKKKKKHDRKESHSLYTFPRVIFNWRVKAGLNFMCSKGAAGLGEVTEEIDFVPYILSCSSQPPLPTRVARRSSMWERAWVHLLIRQWRARLLWCCLQREAVKAEVGMRQWCKLVLWIQTNYVCFKRFSPFSPIWKHSSQWNT